jgi:SpoVK/Ycf46/Vps4 family AAA+-type ATPase
MSGTARGESETYSKKPVELAPSVIFIDEINTIVVKREESNREKWKSEWWLKFLHAWMVIDRFSILNLQRLGF